MRGYELNIEVKAGAEGFMRNPIPLTKEKLELLHALLDEWIAARHARLMTAQERSECYRAARLFWKTERGKLRPRVDYSTLNLECNLVATRCRTWTGSAAISQGSTSTSASTYARRSTRSC